MHHSLVQVRFVVAPSTVRVFHLHDIDRMLHGDNGQQKSSGQVTFECLRPGRRAARAETKMCTQHCPVLAHQLIS